MSDTISKIKLGGTTYAINDQTKVSQESFDELMSISNENKSSIELVNNKLDELLNKALNSGSMDFFKCAEVGPAESGDTEDGGDTGSSTTSTDIIVSGFSDERFNGRYSMQDTSATGIYRVWAKDDTRIQTDMDTDENMALWRFVNDEWNNEDNPSIAHSHMPYENPWDTEEWFVYTDFHGISGTPVVTLASGSSDSGSTSEIPANTWNGYKAILKEETETIEIPGIASIIVSGCTYDTDFNGTYTLVDASATGTNRVWKNEKNKYLAFNPGGENWCLYAELDGLFFYNNYYPNYPDYTIPENPWDAEYWENIMGASDVPVFTVNQSVGTTETKTIKYYVFEETFTTGLTYGKGFTPVVDKVYDSEAMIMATLFVKELPILSTPDNLTDYENDEWKVFADNEFAEHIAWHAFDGNPDSIWADSGSGYLTWQNKLRQVLVRQLEFIYDGNAHSNYVLTIILEGSDNGSDWSEIGSASLTYTIDGNYEKATVTFPSNETSYFYHRIYARGQGRNLIGSLIGKRVIE